jgi:hypothetical protein
MSDDLERRLHELPRTRLPAAPVALRRRVAAIVATEPVRGERSASRRSIRLVLAVAAVLVGAALLSTGIIGRHTPPTSVDGLPVMTVTEAIAAHRAGSLPGGRAAIRGYWSNGSIGHMCAAPPEGEVPGELELYCHDNEAGITEQDEPILVVEQTGYVSYQARGPHLAPWISEAVEGVDALGPRPWINGQPFPPVPIVVTGHFDDPRAAQCRPEARQLCLDRLVLERVVEFDAGAVATPGVTPPPTPFPDPPPAALFGADRCAGDISYSFVGWTTEAELGVDRGNPGHVWAMVTRDVIQRTDGWQDDPNGSGHQFQSWGRLVCWAPEDPHGEGAVNLASQPGSGYVLWDDGLKVPGDDLQPRPAPTS